MEVEEYAPDILPLLSLPQGGGWNKTTANRIKFENTRKEHKGVGNDRAKLVLEARWGGGWGGHQGEELLISISARGFVGSLYLDSGRKLGDWWKDGSLAGGSQEQRMKVLEQEDGSDLSLREATGEVTPPPTPKSKKRSPRVQAKHFSRLLQFQQQLPTSRLQVRSRLEQVTTPSPSSPTSPCLRQGQRQEEETQEEVEEGRDLSVELVRIGAEALLLPLITLVRVLPGKGLEGERQENQTARYPGGGAGPNHLPHL